MKLKKILSNIEEKWVAGFENEIADKYLEIFKNPSLQELNDIDIEGFLKEGYRFIAMKDSKDIFVASISASHPRIIKYVDELRDRGEITNNFSGMANDRKLIYNFADSYFVESLGGGDRKKFEILMDDIENGVYDWIENYGFKMTDVIIERGRELLRTQF